MDYFVTETDSKSSIAVDDTILAKGFKARAGSHILDDFKPLFSAYAVERLEKAGYEVYRKINTGEFGFDLVGETSCYGVRKRADGTLSTAGAEGAKTGVVKQALCINVKGAQRRGTALSDTDFIKPNEGMGFTMKVNTLFGSDVLSKDKYQICYDNYDKSLRIRRLAFEKTKEVSSQYDAVLCPVMSTTSVSMYDASETFERTKRELLYTTVPSMVGIPTVIFGESSSGVRLRARACFSASHLRLRKRSKDGL